jgi:hypothetical protein
MHIPHRARVVAFITVLNVLNQEGVILIYLESIYCFVEFEVLAAVVKQSSVLQSIERQLTFHMNILPASLG